MSNNEYNPSAARRAQAEFCRTRDVPRFAPSDGVCWACGNQIYAPSHAGRSSGITVAEAASRQITGCPHCNRTFLD